MWVARTILTPAGNWSESLLKAMYFVTLQHGGAFPHEIERLWSTVAANKRNVIPILEFLISRGLQELNAQVPFRPDAVMQKRYNAMRGRFCSKQLDSSLLQTPLRLMSAGVSMEL